MKTFAPNTPVFLKKTREAVRPLEEALQLELSPHEISYLCLHFGAALRNTESRSLLRCALVCGSGIGTARMMQAKLTQEFILEVVGTFGAREIASVDPSSYDLIISSLPLPGRWAKDYLLVNPLLPEADLLHLEEFLLRRRCTTAPASQDAEELLRRIKKYAQPRDEDALLQEIQTWMDGMPEKPSGLLSLLGERIELQASLKTPKEVLHRALAPLIQAGFAPEGYEEAVERLLETSDRMLLTKDLALLHAADPSVQDVGFSLLTLNRPVAFGREATHPVRVVFAFCAPQKGEGQQEALRDLLSLLQRPRAIEGLAAATTHEEARTFLDSASS